MTAMDLFGVSLRNSWHGKGHSQIEIKAVTHPDADARDARFC